MDIMFMITSLVLKLLKNNMSNINDQMSNCRLKWIEEDKLPDYINVDIYEAMYRVSILNGVRMFPYIEFPSGLKYYLIEISEDKEDYE